jgi:membrane-associated phospholipid phosphatase
LDKGIAFPVRMGILILTLLIWLGVYFIINKLPDKSHRRLRSNIPLDRNIPFIPQLAIVYFSTFLFALEPFFILTDPKLFRVMLVSFAAISIMASLIHAFFPSQIQRIEKVNTEILSGKMIHLFQSICKPYGNFPSMHVALSVPVVFLNYMAEGPVIGSITFIWAILIALSTLFTKQHHILDVLAGFSGGLLIFGTVYLILIA